MNLLRNGTHRRPHGLVFDETHRRPHGLVIGKFYPFHIGHNYLIETAKTHSMKTHVIVCHKPHEIPTGIQRYEWIKRAHPDVTTYLYSDTGKYDSSEDWARLTIEILGFKPDAVFLSETYGELYSKYLGCENVVVDLERRTFPVSGTMIRNNPQKNLDNMLQHVRQFYVPRVVIVGAESTGKTTLAKRLTDHFKVSWIPEYAREVCEKKLELNGGKLDYQFTTEDFNEIAKQQTILEDKAAENSSLVICDTDTFASGIWHERYIGCRSDSIERLADEHDKNIFFPKLYLVSDPNIKFVQDGTRDGESIRTWMHERFIQRLKETNRKYVVLSGTYDERFETAVKSINDYFKF